jgi:hypothetical protein
MIRPLAFLESAQFWDGPGKAEIASDGCVWCPLILGVSFLIVLSIIGAALYLSWF